VTGEAGTTGTVIMKTFNDLGNNLLAPAGRAALKVVQDVSAAESSTSRAGAMIRGTVIPLERRVT
jgi:hypothetical protein